MQHENAVCVCQLCCQLFPPDAMDEAQPDFCKRCIAAWMEAIVYEEEHREGEAESAAMYGENVIYSDRWYEDEFPDEIPL